MNRLIIDEHAFKHGLAAEDILRAWSNFAVKQYRGAPNEGEVAAIGFDRGGNHIEIVAAERTFGTIVFHAIAPPTRRMLRELSL